MTAQVASGAHVKVVHKILRQNNQRNPEGDLEMPELAFLYSECGCSDSCSEFNDTRCCTYCIHGSYCSCTEYCTEDKHEGCCSYCPGGKVDKDKGNRLINIHVILWFYFNPVFCFKCKKNVEIINLKV